MSEDISLTVSMYNEEGEAIMPSLCSCGKRGSVMIMGTTAMASLCNECAYGKDEDKKYITEFGVKA